MKSKYLVDTATFELPEIDPLITEFVEKQEVGWGDDVFYLGVMHNGVIYRRLMCEEGAHDFIPFKEFMHDHGYTELVGESSSLKGYSMLFVHNSALR